jgi:hypothetical protein
MATKEMRVTVLSLGSRPRSVRDALALVVLLAALTFGIPGTAAVAATRVEPWHLSWQQNGVGSINMWVYYNHVKKIQICDYRSDRAAPLLQIDPSGPQAPITYSDTNAADGRCFNRTLGYSIRKLRVGTFNSWYSEPFWERWYSTPVLPYPDF